MAGSDERTCIPAPAGELHSRWSKARAEMRARDIDALIIQGANGLAGGDGYSRWFTGIASPTTYPQSVIFPAEGLISLVHHGDLGGEIKHDGSDPALPGVGDRFTTAAFPSVWYTAGLEADIICREVKKYGFKTVGLVGPNLMYHGFVARLTELLMNVKIVDATETVDRIKAIKSPYDIECIQRSAAMQDEIIRRIRGYIRPGMRDFEVLAYGHYLGQLLGSEQGYFLGSSAPRDEPALLRLRPQQGRRIDDGDVFLFQAENSGPDGFYVHMARMFVLGKAPQALVDACGAAVEAQDYTVKLLQPGARCRDIFADYNSYMRSRGYAEERRLHCHGQGYESVERPLIRHDETMDIAADMNVGVHPAVVHKQTYMWLTDNFLTRRDAPAEHLHKTPREIIEL